jgi:hypothetical protein
MLLHLFFRSLNSLFSRSQRKWWLLNSLLLVLTLGLRIVDHYLIQELDEFVADLFFLGLVVDDA